MALDLATSFAGAPRALAAIGPVGRSVGLGAVLSLGLWSAGAEGLEAGLAAGLATGEAGWPARDEAASLPLKKATASLSLWDWEASSLAVPATFPDTEAFCWTTLSIWATPLAIWLAPEDCSPEAAAISWMRSAVLRMSGMRTR